MYVGIELQEQDSQALCPDPGAQLHLTLAHLGKAQSVTSNRVKALALADALYAYAGEITKVELVLGPTETWNTKDGVIAVKVLKKTEELLGLRQGVLDILAHQDVMWSTDYEWNPHITLGGSVVVGRTHRPIFATNITLIGGPVIQHYRFNFM